MSFDVFLRPLDGALTDETKSRVFEVLKDYRHSGPDQWGYCNIHFSDGTSVEFGLAWLGREGPNDSCAVHIRAELSDHLMEFMMSIAMVSDLAIYPMGADDLIILVSEIQKTRISSDKLARQNIVLVNSTDELRGALERGFEAWSVYSNRVNRAISADDKR